jgi:hypothetical protein
LSYQTRCVYATRARTLPRCARRLVISLRNCLRWVAGSDERGRAFFATGTPVVGAACAGGEGIATSAAETASVDESAARE